MKKNNCTIIFKRIRFFILVLFKAGILEAAFYPPRTNLFAVSKRSF